MKRREFLGMLAAGVAARPDFAFAQQNQAPKRVGFLAHQPHPPVQRFREKLRALGWTEGKNLIVSIATPKAAMVAFPHFRRSLWRCQWTFWLRGAARPHSPPSARRRRFRF